MSRALAAMLVLTVAGCSAGLDESEHPYAAELEQARQQATHPEIKAALEDGTITDAELERLRQIALACLAEHGKPGSFGDDNTLSIIPPDGVTQEDLEATVELCTENTFDLLNPLKESMESNPQNIAWERATVDCFKRFGLVPHSMTPDEFERIDRGDPPWDRLSGDARGCFDDPLNYGGGRPDLDPEEVGGAFSSRS